MPRSSKVLAAPAMLICGTGRCGTAYAAALLSELGLPCGHQSVFSPERPLPVALRVRRRSPWAESSPAALPALREVPDSVVCVHLVRHPLQVLASIERRGFFLRGNEDAYVRFAYAVLPELIDARDPIERAARFVIGWNSAIRGVLLARSPALRSVRIQVEALSQPSGTVAGELLARVGIQVGPRLARAAVARVPRDFNSDGRTESVEHASARVARLPEELRCGLLSLASDYGYMPAFTMAPKNLRGSE